MFSPLASRAATMVFLAVLALALLAACGDGGSSYGGPSEREQTATPQEATRTPDGSSTPSSEMGQDPVFWRTADGFQSLRAGEGYKVVFRITNGYDEPALRVVADRVAGGRQLEFTGNRVMPVGDEGAGSFYPMTVLLPQAGAWNLTVLAGDDQVTIPVEVGLPGAPAG